MLLPVTPALYGSRYSTQCGHPGQRGGWRARVGLCSTIYCGNLYTQKSGPRIAAARLAWLLSILRLGSYFKVRAR